MALYRQIFIDFWRDPKVTEEMSAEDRYTLLYLLTNPYTTQIGVYTITKRQMAFDLGYSTESVAAILERFEKLYKIIRYNTETREIAIKNWGKYNLKRGGKPVLDCIKGELEKVKDKTLIEFVVQSIPNESIKNMFLHYVNDTCDVTSTTSGQEQEKEEEKEEEQQQLRKNETLVVVTNDLKNYFNLLDTDIDKIIKTFLDKNREIEYLQEKIELAKNTSNIKNITGYLIKAIKEDYPPIKSINNKPKLKGGLGYARTMVEFEGKQVYTDQLSEEDFNKLVESKQQSKWN